MEKALIISLVILIILAIGAFVATWIVTRKTHMVSSGDGGGGGSSSNSGSGDTNINISIDNGDDNMAATVQTPSTTYFAVAEAPLRPIDQVPTSIIVVTTQPSLLSTITVPATTVPFEPAFSLILPATDPTTGAGSTSTATMLTTLVTTVTKPRPIITVSTSAGIPIILEGPSFGTFHLE